MTASAITQMYAFGSNGNGQLGVGHTEDLFHPQPCLFDNNDDLYGDDDLSYSRQVRGDTIKKIVAGGNHTLVLTSFGRLFAAGNNEDGRCGVNSSIGSATSFHTVQKLSGKHITDIAASWSASYFVEEEQRVLVLGSGDKGELGLGEGVITSATIRQVFEVTQGAHDGRVISDIAAGMNHIVVLLSNGEIHGWGACRKGQLGEEQKQLKIRWTPSIIVVPFHVKNIAVGRDHTLLNDEQGNILLLGDTRFFQNMPKQVVDRPMSFQSGWSSMLCLNHDKLIGYGRNDRGQLPPDNLEAIEKFATGSEHSIALATQKTIYAWGWGEHGNCGLPLDDRGNVSGRANIIELRMGPGERVAGLGAGCATSFIWTIQNG